jgi:hypothetical protein
MSKSKNYDKVAGFYKDHFWSLAMLKNAVGRWITEDEFSEITENIN